MHLSQEETPKQPPAMFQQIFVAAVGYFAGAFAAFVRLNRDQDNKDRQNIVRIIVAINYAMLLLLAISLSGLAFLALSS